MHCQCTIKKTILFGIFLLCIPAYFIAIEVPDLQGTVNDYANILSATEKAEIETFLGAVNDQTGVQIAVLVIPSLEDESLEGFSIRAVEKWKLGQKNKDNGVLLLVAVEERSVRIETGYGLEGTLTDLQCGIIIRNVIIPAFREGQYGTGIAEGVKNIAGIATANAELVAPSVKKQQEPVVGEGSIGGGLFFLLMLLLLFCRLGLFVPYGGHRRGHYYSGGNFTGGFKGGGFGGGGGFSGGGGGFGGGGASGRW